MEEEEEEEEVPTLSFSSFTFTDNTDNEEEEEESLDDSGSNNQQVSPNAPRAPSGIRLKSSSDTGSSSSDRITSDRTPTVTVSGTIRGLIVAVIARKSGSNSVTGAVIAKSKTEDVTLGTLSDGTWSITARHIGEGPGGELSAETEPLLVTIVRSGSDVGEEEEEEELLDDGNNNQQPSANAPRAPSGIRLKSSSDTGSSSSDRITSDRTPTVTVSGTIRKLIVVVTAQKAGSNPVTAAVVAKYKTENITFKKILSDGTWSITARHVGENGAISAETDPLIITIGDDDGGSSAKKTTNNDDSGSSSSSSSGNKGGSSKGSSGSDKGGGGSRGGGGGSSSGGGSGSAPVLSQDPTAVEVLYLLGQSSKEIRDIQIALNRTSCPVSKSGVGSSGSETEYFGQKTKSAVECFQRANGLPVTGQVDDTTYLILFQGKEAGQVTYSSGVPQGRVLFVVGQSDSGIRSSQVALNSTSCPVATSGVGSSGSETNYFGQKTKSAVECYQRINGLPVTGQLDELTYLVLHIEYIKGLIQALIDQSR